MLEISADQNNHLGAVQKERFITTLAERLRRDFPRQTQPLADPGLRTLIETGIGNARIYGLVNEGHVRFYCGMMLRHGNDFDADPALPWAGEILEDDHLSAAEKLARLDEVQVFLDRAAP